MTTKIVNVTYHHEESSWWAESDDVQGFSAAGDTLEDVRELVHEGIPFALGTSDVDVRESDEHGRTVFVTRVEFLGHGATPAPATLVQSWLQPAATAAAAGPSGLSYANLHDEQISSPGLIPV